MLRYLAELCWFPQAATKQYVTWESIDSTSAKATLNINKKRVSGVFTFNTNGTLLSFEANRYYSGKDDAKLEKWVIEILEHKTFHNIKIPNKCKVIWKLDEGDFNWLILEIIDLDYNILECYKT